MSPNLFEQRDDDMDVDVEGDGMEVDVEADTGGGSTVVAELGGSTAIPAKDKALPHITLTTEDAPENRFHDPRQASSPNITEHSPWTLAGSDPSFVPVVAPFTHTLYLTATSPTEPGDGWRMVSSDRLGNPAFNDANPSMRDSEHPTPSSPNGGVNTLAVETHFSRSNSTRGLKSASSKKRDHSTDFSLHKSGEFSLHELCVDSLLELYKLSRKFSGPHFWLETTASLVMVLMRHYCLLAYDPKGNSRTSESIEGAQVVWLGGPSFKKQDRDMQLSCHIVQIASA
ncbi:hypothetical protein BCR39DRAFT_598136 [Naematelia encephala]|uniref:Uncharacterized protein n=1 Tax=Naematelia encephala TaxID=71784 RepID=A0A1Y2B9X1_9TREE|nr:hypothetical protein BCR39DRAFT_598136 [Naematelia encephala]